MSADDFLFVLTQVVLLAIFAVTLTRAIRDPRRANVDIAALFAAIAGILIVSDVRRVSAASDLDRILAVVALVLVAGLPYLMLRIVDDFRPQPRWVMSGALAILVALIVGGVALPAPLPAWFLMAIGAWFLGLGSYVTASFVRGSMTGGGVTARRMLAAAAGSGLFATAILIAIAGAIAPQAGNAAQILTRISALGAALAYFVAFSTPIFLRRAWQEPELRAFLGRAATLPRLPDTDAIVRELEHGAASSTGGAHAVIGLWDQARRVLIYRDPDDRLHEYPDDQFIGGRSFAAQRAIFSADAMQEDPDHAEAYRRGDAHAVLAAPIGAGNKRIGVLCVYAERAPIFAHDDLELVQLLADQAAVILESRRLIDHAAQVRAREEATRLKDDFLSAAAHDLRTPLTTLLLQAQMLQRQMTTTEPESGAARRVDIIHTEALRLRTLVTDYLDASRAERGELVGRLQPTDVAAIARQACERHASPRHPCRFEGDAQVTGEFDADRLGQLLDNLIGNAVKYSPEGGRVLVRAWSEGDRARLSVADGGIGIPAEDVPHLFDRFHRAANVDDRRFQGLGLGLYICHGIVEQHGGRIWVDSQLGKGSTFHVELPLHPTPAGEEAGEPLGTELRRDPATGPETTNPAGAAANG
jgi:signal transduction histidine kinase